jgi:hypothetical protein
MDFPHYIQGTVSTRIGDIPRISGKLSKKDRLGTLMVRCSINRNNYKVAPGLYAIGNPEESSGVFVTANYKLSFDHLRKNLNGLHAWILVLDTKGINVWCAAGKGTFGTRELVNRIRITRLSEVVSHRRIIVPQLGAVGVSVHEVKKQTDGAVAHTSINKAIMPKAGDFKLSPDNLKINNGFNVVYGPVKAKHIKKFIRNSYVTNREMRKVTFTISERATLIPVDFIQGKYKLLIALSLLFVLSGLKSGGLSFQLAAKNGPGAMLNVFLAYVAGIVLMPLALPYIPGRSFSFKGFLTGAFVFVLIMLFGNPGKNYYEILSWFLMIVAVSSFMAMNFTGSSTFTSLSGVKKEMRTAIPIQIAATAIGLVLFNIGRFV